MEAAVVSGLLQPIRIYVSFKNCLIYCFADVPMQNKLCTVKFVGASGECYDPVLRRRGILCFKSGLRLYLMQPCGIAAIVQNKIPGITPIIRNIAGEELYLIIYGRCYQQSNGMFIVKCLILIVH